MSTPEDLAARFEVHRGHLLAVAYRMLGSTTEAEDAVQEGWIRLDRSDVSGVVDLRAWLTTVVARVCLDTLRARSARREDALDNAGTHVPDPVITRLDGDPEAVALRTESVGLALLVVLDTLEPAERLAMVLHDVFGFSFDEIAPIVDRSAVAARQLASRARRRVQRTAPRAERDLSAQRRVVDAFFAAAREGDLEGLLAVLDPDVVLRADGGAAAGLSRIVRGARAVAEQAATFSRSGLSSELVLVNGDLGFVSRRADGRIFSVLGFTIVGGQIVQIHVLSDPDRLRRMPV